MSIELKDETARPYTRVFLWTSSRSLSSVFTRSIRELPRVKVLFEPHLHVFYNGPGRRSEGSDPKKTLLKDTRCYDEQFRQVDERCLEIDCNFDATFVKNMALYVEGRYEDYVQEQFAAFKHTFLIRNPKKTVTSKFEACKEAKLHFSYPGIRQVYEMYKVVQQIDPNPLVVDADDLLKNPKEMMKLYSSATGLPFTEDMLTWESGDVPEWNHGRCHHVWHRTAMNSSGFMVPTEPRTHDSESLSDICPMLIQQCIADELPYYEALHKVRTRSPVNISP